MSFGTNALLTKVNWLVIMNTLLSVEVGYISEYQDDYHMYQKRQLTHCWRNDAIHRHEYFQATSPLTGQVLSD
eukprot:6204406-Pleurochrysis_carterae.AAC.1